MCFSPVAFSFASAWVPNLWMIVTLNSAFMAGSSKQGNTFLASVGCIWLVAMNLCGKYLLKNRINITTRIEQQQYNTENSCLLVHLDSISFSVIKVYKLPMFTVWTVYSMNCDTWHLSWYSTVIVKPWGSNNLCQMTVLIYSRNRSKAVAEVNRGKMCNILSGGLFTFTHNNMWSLPCSKSVTC